MSQKNPATIRIGNRLYMIEYKPDVQNYPKPKTKVENVNTLPTVPGKRTTKSKRRYIVIIVLILIGILAISITVPLVVENKLVSATTSNTTITTMICKNGGTELSNGTCTCNNYTTGTYCQTPQCLVAGLFSTTCSNNGTCIYNTATETSTCSCPPNLWTGSYCQTPVCSHCDNNCGNGYCNSASSCYCNSGFEGTCCNSTITSGECLSLSPKNTTSWGNEFNNTYYGYEHDIVNVSCTSEKSLTVAACFYGINDVNPGCGGTTVSATCQSMDVTAQCKNTCNTSSCYFQIENTLFTDTCYGKLKEFWMYFTCL